MFWCDREMTIFWEQRAMDNLDPRYNISLIAGDGGAMMGRKHSDESKRKIGAANAGKDTSKAVQASVKARTGRPLSDEHKAKISVIHQGRDMSKQTAASLKARGY